MDIITFSDISKRVRNKNSIITESGIYPRLYASNDTFCCNNAIDAINNWSKLGETTNSAYDKALDIFEEVCLNENESTIKKCCSILIENANKVRDPIQLRNSLKYRNSRLKRKVQTKLTKKYEPVNNAITDVITAMSKKSPINTVPIKTVNECYDELLNEADKNIQCDRIINNYAKINRRFNIDKIFSEASSKYNDTYLSILEFSKYMDTYNTKFRNKYYNTLEACYCALNKYNMNYPSSKIIEAVTDYFIFSSSINESNIKDIEEIKSLNILFNENDFSSINYLFDNSVIEESNIDIDSLIEEYCYPIDEGFKEKKKELIQAKRKLVKDAKHGNPDERVDKFIQKDLNEFRKECIKDPKKDVVTKLKSMLMSIFTKTPYQIVFCLPNVFSIIRGLIVIGSVAINPILGLCNFIIIQILKLNLSRKQTEKIVTAYQNEIDTINDKIEKCKDEDQKKDYKEYLDELNKDYEKIKEYENNLYSSDENYERDTSTTYDKNAKNDDFDFDDFDDWDIDFDIEEAASIVYISDLMQSISEGLIDNSVEGIVFNNLFKLDNSALDTLTDFSITVPVILEKDKLCETFIDYRNDLRKLSDNDINKYITIDCLNENIIKLQNNSPVYATSNNLDAIKCYLACLNEMVNMNSSKEYIMELNFTNTLKLAMDRLKKTATKLKDKDKKISNTIDVAVNNISKSMETAMMNDNREAVIKGRILPSASKCIKIACVEGIAWAINPAIAVIAAIGAFACSKKMKAKERQLIMDDIDIELKMCQRYLKKAEDDGDMKKIRQLEMLQRELTRQQQRIRYKVHVVYKDPVPSIKDTDD